MAKSSPNDFFVWVLIRIVSNDPHSVPLGFVLVRSSPCKGKTKEEKQGKKPKWGFIRSRRHKDSGEEEFDLAVKAVRYETGLLLKRTSFELLGAWQKNGSPVTLLKADVPQRVFQEYRFPYQMDNKRAEFFSLDLFWERLEEIDYELLSNLTNYRLFPEMSVAAARRVVG